MKVKLEGELPLTCPEPFTTEENFLCADSSYISLEHREVVDEILRSLDDSVKPIC